MAPGIRAARLVVPVLGALIVAAALLGTATVTRAAAVPRTAPAGTIAPAPGPARATISGGSLTGVARRRPTLRFGLAPAVGAPALRSFTVTLPPGLSFVAGGITGAVSVRGAEVSLKLSRRGRLSVTMKKAVRSVAVSIGPGGLAVTRELAMEARRHELDELAIRVAAWDAAGQKTGLFIYRYYEVRP